MISLISGSIERQFEKKVLRYFLPSFPFGVSTCCAGKIAGGAVVSVVFIFCLRSMADCAIEAPEWASRLPGADCWELNWIIDLKHKLFQLKDYSHSEIFAWCRNPYSIRKNFAFRQDWLRTCWQLAPPALEYHSACIDRIHCLAVAE